jgi:hypothetical protein
MGVTRGSEIEADASWFDEMFLDVVEGYPGRTIRALSSG